MVVTEVGDVGLDGESKPGIGWAFFEGGGLIAIDLDRRLCCIS